MAFADTVELTIFYTNEISLDSIKEIAQDAGFHIDDGRESARPINRLFIKPREKYRNKNIPQKEEPHPLDPQIPRSSPMAGPYRGHSFGWLTFSPTALHVQTTLGYWLRGHNHLMDNAALSTEALQALIKGLFYHFPFLHRPSLRMTRVDATYQLKIPGYAENAFQLFSLLSAKASVREDVYMHKSLNLYGRVSKSRSWSCYDKYQQIKETTGQEIPELRDVIRLTETVYRKNNAHAWEPLWEDEGNLVFSERGLTECLQKRWNNISFTNTSSIDVSKLIDENPNDYDKIFAYMYMLEHPEMLCSVKNKLHDLKGKRVFDQGFKRKFEKVEEIIKKSASTITINIPDYKRYEKPAWKPCYFEEDIEEPEEMLAVQEYLTTHTLEDLEAEFGITAKVDPELGVALLHYSITSDMSLEICRQCRSLILELDTWNVVCKTFDKFFNYDEPNAESTKNKFVWNTAYVQPKIDGSLIQLYYYKDKWNISTTGNANAFNAPITKDYSFGHLFMDTLKKMGTSWEELIKSLERYKDCYFALELATPKNQVIVPYNDYRIYYLACFQNCNEHSPIVEIIPTQQFPLKYLEGSCLKDISLEELKNKADSISASDGEGFVVVDVTGNRLKVKSSEYLYAHKSNNFTSNKTKLKIVLSGKYDDIQGVISSSKKEELDIVMDTLKKLTDIAYSTYDKHKYIEDKKEFALSVRKYPFSYLLFNLRNNISVEQSLQQITIPKLLETIENTFDESGEIKDHYG